MAELGRTIIIFGIVLVGVGLLLTFSGRIPFIGRLPGDIYIRREGFVFYFPIVTSIVASILLSLIFSLFRR